MISIHNKNQLLSQQFKKQKRDLGIIIKKIMTYCTKMRYPFNFFRTKHLIKYQVCSGEKWFAENSDRCFS